MRIIGSKSRYKKKRDSINNGLNARTRRVVKRAKFKHNFILPTIDEGEYLNEITLKKDLEPYVFGIKLAINVVIEAFLIPPEIEITKIRSSRLVSQTLIIKIINDLRTLLIIGTKGYPIQAATIASSLYETSYMLGLLGDDDELSDRWIEHSDPASMSNVIESINKMTKKTIKKQTSDLDIDYDPISKAEYKKYQQLCMAKHSNPLIQKHIGIFFENNSFIGEFGPDKTQYALRLICFSLENSIGFVMSGLVNYVNDHLREFDTRQFVSLYNKTADHYKKLRLYSLNKWGSESISDTD
ncbi:hypothetical protein [Paenibacillus sp. JJ-223]|uniref:hypothetical protein n=1 Tax=Paenibacillus sp. JJ-223 TaxID=2905647 RepID=UPI001F462088|nr:hypothetical protein [Paenibacillus sp. JJ-223]CAH1216178.1 hypothetical protein PAECIP111890_04370 [Paenibacillus sp. JJ-223]